MEKHIIDNLQHLLLEQGKGFAFIEKQQRISLGNRHFYVDLVFYHTKFKCDVLIDLKTGEAGHHACSQMNTYFWYYAKEVRAPPI